MGMDTLAGFSCLMCLMFFMAAMLTELIVPKRIERPLFFTRFYILCSLLFGVITIVLFAVYLIM